MTCPTPYLLLPEEEDLLLLPDEDLLLPEEGDLLLLEEEDTGWGHVTYAGVGACHIRRGGGMSHTPGWEHLLAPEEETYFRNLWISASSTTPRSAKHTIRCASKSEYGLPEFQNKLWSESRVMPKNVRKHNESGNSVDSQINVFFFWTKKMFPPRRM